MKLKQAVIGCIISLSEGQEVADLPALYGELFPDKPLPDLQSQILLDLGDKLKKDSIPDKDYSRPSSPQQFKTVIEQETANVEMDAPEVAEAQSDVMSIEGVLALQEYDLQQNRKTYHQHLINATSNEQRKALYGTLAQIQSQIDEKRRLIKDANDGKPVTLPEPKEDPREEYAIIPEDLNAKTEKIQRLSALRSKRKKVMDQNEKDSTKYKEAASEWEYLDKCIRKLREAKKRQV